MAVRATFNNARSGKDGVFLAKHLDGPDGKAAKLGGLLYTWHCDTDKEKSFEQVEADFYEKHFRAVLDVKNERYRKFGHKERIRTMDEYRTAKNTCPESTLFYLGDKDRNAGPDVLQKVVVEFWKWRKTAFPNVKSLDLALHIEDGAPHIHERHVWIAHDKDGNEIVNQEAALREMGVKPPKSGKIDRFNNAKMTFTEICREQMIEIARSHGLEIVTDPREAGQKGLSQARFKTQDEQRKQADAMAGAAAALADRDAAKLEAEKLIKDAKDEALIAAVNIKLAARAEAKKIKAQAVQDSVQEATEKLEHLTGAIITAEQELGDLTEYKAWKAQKAAQAAQDAAKKREAEEQARKAAEAKEPPQEAQERELLEQEARRAAQAAQEADTPKTAEEMYRAAQQEILCGTPTRTAKPASPLEQLKARTDAAIREDAGRDGPCYPGS